MPYTPSPKERAMAKERRPIRVPILARRLDGREVLNYQRSKPARVEYRRRTLEMRDRQKEMCAICSVWMSEEEATFEHEAGRGANGSHRDDRITNLDGTWKNAAAHANCNSLKGSRRFRWVDGNRKYQEVV